MFLRRKNMLETFHDKKEMLENFFHDILTFHQYCNNAIIFTVNLLIISDLIDFVILSLFNENSHNLPRNFCFGF